MLRSLDDLEGISKIDAGNMLGAINRFPDFLVDAAHFSPLDVRSSLFVHNIVLMGMGGSASAADVLLDWLQDRIRVPVSVVRDSELPRFVGPKTLFMAVSYSGETAETLAAFNEARKRRCITAAVASGGRLQTICSRRNIPFLQVASGLVPRAALSQMVGAGAVMMQSFGVVEDVRVGLLEAGHELIRIRGQLRAEVPLSRNRAKQNALRLRGKLPVIYCLQHMSSVARRAKNQFAENSKVVAKYDLLPEAGHNEVEAWQGRNPHILPVLVHDSKESREESTVFRAFKAVLRKLGEVRTLEVRTGASSALGRLLGPVLFLDYVSVYLAFLRGVDPTPTTGIREYRRLYATARR